jgi:mercuric ion binding protein
MKIISIFILSIGLFSCYPPQGNNITAPDKTAIALKTETFKVWGNCGMCKKNIEGALKVKGISKAIWNNDSQMLTVSFDNTKITLEQIHQKIAAVGYDTEKQKGSNEAYNALPACCQYNRK